MVEKNQTQEFNIRINQSRDNELFDYFSVDNKLEKLRTLFALNKQLEERNKELTEELSKYKNDLVGIKLSSRQAQKNTDMMLGILNTWLFSQNLTQPISLQEKRHPLIGYFDSEYRRMLDNVMQHRTFNDQLEITPGPIVEPQIEQGDYEW
ncbi:hypothetical protein [Lactococcus allomyrinae]|uniref:Uncharacterized protein n=1 Tax=Lactococcus allomyrinae TaxID=2419773 RepID=A0A387BJN1_9LACT|nr:hypothetical protein [Lactococcus allomyrinae]AYG01140.1 hypothetical protein D7I46_08555 [Lactococcus allomyrinae]